MARRTLGFIVTVVVTFFAGYQLAWNRDVVDRLGGIGGLIGAILFLSLGFLAIFWPDRWKTNGHRVTIAGALVAFLLGGEFIRKAFVEAPVATVLWIAGGLVVLGILYFLTVVNVMPRWVNTLRSYRPRLTTRPAPTQTP